MPKPPTLAVWQLLRSTRCLVNPASQLESSCLRAITTWISRPLIGIGLVVLEASKSRAKAMLYRRDLLIEIRKMTHLQGTTMVYQLTLQRNTWTPPPCLQQANVTLMVPSTAKSWSKTKIARRACGTKRKRRPRSSIVSSRKSKTKDSPLEHRIVLLA